MTHVHFFQWNIPADNHYTGKTDGYINIIAEWDGKTTYGYSECPLIIITPINLSFYDCISVKNWALAHSQIEKIAEKHFAEIAKAERIAQARAELIAAGEPTGNPVIDRYTEKMHDLIIQETLS